MGETPIRVLLIEGSQADAALVRRCLDRAPGGPFSVAHATTLADGLERIAAGGIDVTLLDLILPDSVGLQTLSRVSAAAPEVPIVVLTGMEEDLGDQVFQAGAQEYLVKSHLHAEMLARVLRYSIERHRLQTELARRARELEAAEARLRVLIEKNADAILVLDQGGVVRFANPAAEALFGRPREELLGQEFGLPIVAGETTGLDIIRPGRENALVEMRLVEALLEDQPHYVATLRDITERRRLEEQLHQAQKMEAIGQLAGGIAHDFNNLLTIITGRTQLLLGRLAPDDPRRAEVDLIDRTAGRAAALTRQLLAFSRRQVLQPKVLDVSAVVGNLASMLRRLIGEDIDLLIQADPGVWWVMADSAQLEQVIMNLAINARDAMPSGGRLTIAVGDLDQGEELLRRHPEAPAGRYVTVTVSDTGIGMDEATRSRLFQPFFTTKEVGKGTGLGLATVYGIVRQHEGYIWVESEPGEGTTFTLCLPLVDAPAEAIEAAPGPTGVAAGSETILLVEDEEDLRDLGKEILQGLGYRVLEAGDPAEALAIAERHQGPIHLLVTDVVMPQMSGRQLAERLAPLQPGMRVLYISGYPDDALGPHGVLDPGTFLLEKPFTPDALAHEIRRVLEIPLERSA